MVIITYYFDLQIKEPIEVQKCYITVIWTTSKHVMYTNEFSQHSLMRSNRRQMCEQRSKKEEGKRGVLMWWKGKAVKISTCTLWLGVRREEGPRGPSCASQAHGMLSRSRKFLSHFLKLSVRSTISGCREANRGRGQLFISAALLKPSKIKKKTPNGS